MILLFAGFFFFFMSCCIRFPQICDSYKFSWSLICCLFVGAAHNVLKNRRIQGQLTQYNREISAQQKMVYTRVSASKRITHLSCIKSVDIV